MNYLEYGNQGPEIAIYTIFGLSALLIRSIWTQGRVLITRPTCPGPWSHSFLIIIWTELSNGSKRRYDNCSSLLYSVCAKISQITGFDTNLLFLCGSLVHFASHSSGGEESLARSGLQYLLQMNGWRVIIQPVWNRFQGRGV